MAGSLYLSLVLLVVWVIVVTIFVPVLTFLGLSTTAAAGAISVLFFIAYWVIGPDYLFDFGLLRSQTSDDG